MLPTEDRFKNLSEETKYLLYVGFLETALPEEIHESYRISREYHLDPAVERGLRKAGYTDAQIAQYKEDLQKALEWQTSFRG